MKTVIITGATGFLGRQILTSFKRAGWNAIGTGFTRASPPLILEVDLSDKDQVGALLDEYK